MKMLQADYREMKNEAVRSWSWIMEQLILSLLAKSIIGKDKKSIEPYFNNKCFMEDSNGSIKVRDFESEDLIFVVSYNSSNIVTNIL